MNDLISRQALKEVKMLNSFLYFLYLLAYSIYVIFLSFGCVVTFLLLMGVICTIASYIDQKKEE